MSDFVDRTGRGTVTVLLRCLTRSGESGQLVGHAEIVDTGEIVAIRDAAELISLIRRLSS